MALQLRHLDAIFGELLLVRHQLARLERRQMRVARRLNWLVHTVKEAFEEARANETGNGCADFVWPPDRSRRESDENGA